MPSEWTEVPTPTHITVNQLGARLSEAGATIIVFTDGSGGKILATRDYADVGGHGLFLALMAPYVGSVATSQGNKLCLGPS